MVIEAAVMVVTFCGSRCALLAQNNPQRASK
jgi:hypothetical protein